MIEVVEGALEDLARRVDLLDRGAERAAALANARLGGAEGYPEDLADLGRGELLPVVQLERDLIAERDTPEPLEQYARLLPLDEPRVGPSPELLGRPCVDVDVLVQAPRGARALPGVITEDMVGDAEEVRPEARLLAKPVEPLQAGEKHPLEELIARGVIDLVVKKPGNGRVIPIEELRACATVAAAPAGAELGLLAHNLQGDAYLR